MDFLDLSNPYLVVILLLLVLVVLVFWNRYNSNTLRKRRNRSFRNRYHEKKNTKDEDLY